MCLYSREISVRTISQVRTTVTETVPGTTTVTTSMSTRTNTVTVTTTSGTSTTTIATSNNPFSSIINIPAAVKPTAIAKEANSANMNIGIKTVHYSFNGIMGIIAAFNIILAGITLAA
ncbi:8717_t:CDS:2 [Ambispora gerdemannii]|uniref:8717_t:CDS:1 n=1 Tax=Ambispora gerdemannii TaxID=144530 RepID=A0A9N9CTX6_9GLOM|nr:8717_t:CDS:2 [Ambispora gerdemannii]